MQFNNHATNQDIVSLADKMAKSNSVSFPIEEKTLYANLGSRLLMSIAHEAYGGWKYDDKNQTDLPIATTNLVSGQDTYTIPIDSSFVSGVYYQNENSTTWEKIKPITLEEIPEAEPEYYSTDSIPTYYRLVGNQIKIYPASNFSKDNALMVEYSRDISAFATTDTTKTPGWDSQFHDILPIYMSYQYELANHIVTRTGRVPHEENWMEAIERFRKHYSQKFREMFPPKIKLNYNFNDYL